MLLVHRPRRCAQHQNNTAPSSRCFPGEYSLWTRHLTDICNIQIPRAVPTPSIKRPVWQLWTLTVYATGHSDKMLDQCWASVADVCPTLNQHCVNLLCWPPLIIFYSLKGFRRPPGRGRFSQIISRRNWIRDIPVLFTISFGKRVQLEFICSRNKFWIFFCRAQNKKCSYRNLYVLLQ